ncbi:Alpha/beta hydrolase family protein [Pseudoruegeria aquimaris]|uniref:Alpha/beta hydrolase family protein n=1 Tax=Pseudoruegeria aquimaris TaxID=393663 RepID=A0A1Y5RU97_9RHOB|nr:alpha/beta hydrolase [Pseudoruegeria aquimaris]SLN24389.1 Alpha/beta hydrolase family protein [Pseudoruegeria aquimaris]
MRVFLNLSALMACLLVLVACIPRGAIYVAPEAAEIGTQERVFVATTRAREADGTYGNRRSRELSFARLDISVPPDRRPGSVTWPGRRPDAEEDFLASSFVNYGSASDFRTRLAQEIRNTPSANGRVIVFVHGFNTNFAEGLYRAAQMKADYGFSEPLVHFSWASAASPFGYARDRDSILASRSAFEQFLREIRAAGARQIVVSAHSVGSHLVMETLRQVALRSPADKARLFSEVVLISPDIDVDVFRAQMEDIGPLPQPILVLSSSLDRALAVSATITGAEARIGNLREPEQIEGLDVLVIDVSEFTDGDLGNHMITFSSEEAIDAFTRLAGLHDDLLRETRGRTGPLSGAILSVQEATRLAYESVDGVER